MLIFKTPGEITLEIAERAKQMRLSLNLTQEGLALRSNVSLGSLKRFEHTGQISFESLLKIAFSLNAIEPFNALFVNQHLPITIEELLKKTPVKKRGRFQ